MSNSYLGTLDRRDPLYEILIDKVCPDVHDPRFHVRRLSSSNVYHYTEESTRIAIIGKFFRLDDNRAERVSRIQGEYDNLLAVRGYGFSGSPNYVVRPITRDFRVGLALVAEYIEGKDLDHFIRAAICRGENGLLKKKLARLGSFLHALHARTITPRAVRAEPLFDYFIKIVDKLGRQTLLDGDGRHRLVHLAETWLNRDLFHGLNGSLVHGDATPTNFLFPEGGDIVAIDLERMKETDMAYDVGMVCGELKHAFLWRTANPQSAEPFIRHFLDVYAGHFPDAGGAFRAITARNPFYMAMAELRIARNEYLQWEYRKRLVHEASECLRWGLKL
jgi:aminoglycoside phosphotransferase (APT) family kinase protein